VRLDSEVQPPSLGCDVEDAFERDGSGNRVAVVESGDARVGCRRRCWLSCAQFASHRGGGCDRTH
jgi:hypothetical protein